MPIFQWGTSLDPMMGLRWLQRELDRLADRSWPFGDNLRVGGGSYPPVNVFSGEDDIVVMAELPGVARQDLDLSITGETLVIKGQKRPPKDDETRTYQRRERGCGEFSRTIILPDRVNGDKVEAKLANGVLTIRLPKSESAKPRQIAVQE